MDNQQKPARVMVLCTGNSCRSQMAEGYFRELGARRVEAFSAGLLAAGINEYAIKVMREDGIDITMQTSNEIDVQLLNSMDIVITVCSNAEAACPMTPPSVRRMHFPIDDPVNAMGTPQVMDEFRRARQQIRRMVQQVLNELKLT